MMRLLSLTGLLLALAVLPGCAIKSRLTGLAYGDFRDRVVGIKLYYEDPRGRIRTVTEVGDPSILAFFIKELDRAEPIPPPDRQLPDTYYLAFNVATPEGVRETEPYRYLFQTWNDEPGYLELAGQWVKVSPEFKGLLYELGEYRQATGAIEPGDAAFLRGHGWTPLFKIASRTVRLPAQFLHRAGDFPEAIYWAYNNELNRDLGLDLTPYLGRDVEVNLYKVLEPLPEFMHPRRRAGRAVVVKSGGQIVGAWLDAGRHYGFACSLKGRRLEAITGRTFEEWVAGIIDYEDETERQLAAMPPEEIIRTYFGAASRRDYRLAHACETRAALTGYLFR
ncbi:MAG: DUF4830 domain-containing protein, partial [Firmicutes bacterium]|nr:DUF4830 domain-containing protein [Bacillota bacterium]